MDAKVRDKLLYIQQQIEEVINRTPTGREREALTDINILLLSVIAGQPADLSKMIEDALEQLTRSKKC